MHAFPRVNELDPALDQDPRAVYFRQASYGVPIRMALISQLLGLGDAPLARFDGGFRRAAHPIHEPPTHKLHQPELHRARCG